MDAIIHFVITYNEKIIYVLGGLVCILSAVVAWWQVFGKKGVGDSQAVQVDLSGIEESLKKILSQTNAAIDATTAQTPVSGASVELKDIVNAEGKPITDVEGVKVELETRAKIIQDLRKEVKEAKEQDASAELLAKIKGLESRLAEYEIIEDDIADLSVLKEENANLKKEIEGLKRNGPQMVDQFAQALAEAEGQPGSDAKAGSAAATGAIDAAGTLENEAPLAAAIEGMLSNESAPEMAVQKKPEAKSDQEALVAAAVAAAQTQVDSAATLANDSAPATPAVQAVEASAPPAEAVSAKAPAEAVEASAPPADAVKGDIFGEFSSDQVSEDPLAALGDIDPDKMLEELQSLNIEDQAGVEALGEATDIEKMAQEVTILDNKKG